MRSMALNFTIIIYITHYGSTVYTVSGFLSREKTFANFAFLWRFARVFSAKIYFQAIRYRASGRGALGYCKSVKVFSAKIYFQAIRKSFLPRKKPAIRYGDCYGLSALSPYLRKIQI